MKTQVKGAKPSFAPGTSRTPRNHRMFAFQMAMEIERRQEMADRIRQLRGPKPQPVIAAEVGVGLRTYQNWEEAATTPEWENLESLAHVHGVSTNFILYGDEAPRAPQRQLDHIEQVAEETLALLRQLGAVGPQRPPGELGRELSADPPKPQSPRRKRRQKGQDDSSNTG